MQRIAILDSLRAFAALSVCLFHFVYTTTGYFQNAILLDIFSVGKYGVQTFFVISGFIIPWSMDKSGYTVRNFFRFFLKRLARLEPPYVVSILLAVVLIFARGFFYHDETPSGHFDIIRFLLHFFYLIPFFHDYTWFNQVYWTLAIEFQYYIFIALLFPLLSYSKLSRWLFFLMTVAGSFLTGNEFLPYWLPFFSMGILLFMFTTKKVAGTEFLLLQLILVIFAVARYPIAAVVFAAIPVASVLWLMNYTIPILHNIGKYSYSIYLLHPLVGGTVINVLSHRYYHSSGEKAFVVLVGVILTLGLSWIAYLLVERPSQRLSSKISYLSKDSEPDILIDDGAAPVAPNQDDA